MAYGPPTTLDPTNVMGRRIASWFVDIVIPSIVAIAVGYIVFIGAATKVPAPTTNFCTFQPRPTNSACIQVGDSAYVGTDDDVRAAFTVGGLIYLVGALNLFVVQGVTGATVGKHMLGLRVVKADGSVAGFGSNALRTLLLIVDQFFCALVGLITALATHPHRRVGDMAAGTFVVAKQSVGTPIATQMGVAPYPQAWTPPGQTTWGQPAASGTQPWGAPTPGWGTPPSASPPPAATPPTWGTPAATPPASSPSPATEVTSDPRAEDAPGWGAPTTSAQPAPAPVSEPAPQAATPQAGAPGGNREPQWDAQRNAWVYWEAETSRWLQFDAASGQWGPLR